MPQPKWTLMLVPHDNEQVRSFQISPQHVRAALALCLLSAFTLATFSVGFFVKESQEWQARRLKKENLLLAAEVDQMRSEMEQLGESLETLSAKDQKFRVISGLPELDSDVLRVGVGGPGSAGTEARSLGVLNPAVGERVRSTSSDLGTLMRRANLLHSSMDEALRALHENTERVAATPSIAPSTGYLSSLFSNNRRHPVLRITRPHKGIDIAAPVGQPILAPAKGVVRFSGHKPGGYGNVVEIDHGFGYVTRFAHASRLLVRTGERVKRGEVIAEVGATGLVSGPHLHYEVEVSGKSVDPLNFILADAIPD
ncbi:MAG: M23 family metallopeptidase [Gemmatimonadota bacterium]|jgi:murein DD-endopeptidase MepM/ murein hydrolase activator NlpD|nr:M23 family metallopeptidase [Gemmatimonadota bacterium]